MSALETLILRVRDAFIEHTGTSTILVTPEEGTKLGAPPIFEEGSWLGIEFRDLLSEHYGPVQLSYTDFNILWRRLTADARPDRAQVADLAIHLSQRLPTLPIPLGKDVRDVRELLVLLMVAADYAGLGRLSLTRASARITILADTYEVLQQHAIAPWGMLRYPRKLNVNLQAFLGRSVGTRKSAPPRLSALHSDVVMVWPEAWTAISLAMSIAMRGGRTSVFTRNFEWDSIDHNDTRLSAIADALRAVQTSGLVPVNLMTRACLAYMTSDDFKRTFVDCGRTYNKDLRVLHRKVLAEVRRKVIADPEETANDIRTTKALLRAQGITK